MQRWDTINGIHGQTVTISLVADSQLKWGIDVALLLVASDVDIELAWALIGEPVDEPWVGVEVEYDGFVVCEDGGPLSVAESVGMVDFRDEFEEIDYVDESDLEVWKELAEESGGSERLMCGYITAGCHDDIRLDALVIGGPVPDAETLGAVLNGLFHLEILQMILLVGDDDIDVVVAAQAMVCHGKKTVSIRWKVDTDDFWALVGDNIEETRILVSETVVVLSPDGGCEENVKRGNLDSPFNFITLLNPFAVLVNHGVDDVDEWLVAVKQTMATRKNVAFQPTLTSVLTEHLHHTTVHDEISSVLVLVKVLSHPDLLACLVDLAKFVRLCLIWAKNTEVCHVLSNDISEHLCHVGHAWHE